jgi:hypothetical protein
MLFRGHPEVGDADLRLDPVLHLKIAVAIVAPLMGGAGEPVPAPAAAQPTGSAEDRFLALTVRS